MNAEELALAKGWIEEWPGACPASVAHCVDALEAAERDRDGYERSWHAAEDALEAVEQHRDELIAAAREFLFTVALTFPGQEGSRRFREARERVRALVLEGDAKHDVDCKG